MLDTFLFVGPTPTCVVRGNACRISFCWGPTQLALPGEFLLEIFFVGPYLVILLFLRSLVFEVFDAVFHVDFVVVFVV